MHRTYLVACLAEEAGELIRSAGKVLRFGQDNYDPAKAEGRNLDDLTREYNDLVAVAELIGIKRNEVAIQAKKDKLASYF